MFDQSQDSKETYVLSLSLKKENKIEGLHFLLPETIFVWRQCTDASNGSKTLTMSLVGSLKWPYNTITDRVGSASPLAEQGSAIL